MIINDEQEALDAVVGFTIVKAEYLPGSFSGTGLERIVITMNDGTVLTIEPSEWFASVETVIPEGQ